MIRMLAFVLASSALAGSAALAVNAAPRPNAVVAAAARGESGGEPPVAKRPAPSRARESVS